MSRPGRSPDLPGRGVTPLLGLALSLALHALLLAVAHWPGGFADAPRPPAPRPEITVVHLPPPEPAAPPARRAPEPPRPSLPPAAQAPEPPPRPSPQAAAPEPPRPAASQAAPPAPTAEEWAFAARYTLKNSKAYRYTWGQQVRSMMGTAVEGPDQGMVRFRVEIAPDGSVARVETLWSTSPVAERLVREAIARMPRGPATPTGQPLIFERTLVFSPFASDGPPLYRHDCEPDVPGFRNAFAWTGGSTDPPAAAGPIDPPDPPDPQALADCLKQLPKDSIEAESARDQRLMERWGWSASAVRP